MLLLNGVIKDRYGIVVIGNEIGKSLLQVILFQ